MIRRILTLLVSMASVVIVKGQTLDGNAVYSFLRMPFHAQTAAMGGRNVSQIASTAGIISENPALLRPNHHKNVFSNFTFLAPGITGLQGGAAWHQEKIATTFALGLTHLQYGEEPLTDPSGNVSGDFRAFDQALALSASRKYGQHWFYGATFRFVHAAYGPWRSMGMAMDMGLNYYKEDAGLQWGFTVKNMGLQLTKFDAQAEDLPFDMVMGVSKKLDKAPFSISLTAQRLHDFNILYSDTAYNLENFGVSGRPGWGKQLLSHLVLGTQVFVGEKITLSGGFNLLRRNELAVWNVASGMAGFSYGIALRHKKLDFQFARSHNLRSLSQQQIAVVFDFGGSAQ
jgi:hypothetical protein